MSLEEKKSSAENLITQHLDTWTQAIETKSAAGRGSSSKLNLVGIQKLRELILEMAVRGLLVPQDLNDEPASELLKKIAAEKAQLIKDKKIKKTKALPEISEDEKPFDLPSGWEWVRTGNTLDFQYGKSLPAKSRNEQGSIEVFGSNGVVGFHDEAIFEKPCIIIGRKGSAGALNKTLKPSWITDVAFFVEPPIGHNFDYTYLILKSLKLDALGKGIKPGVNRNEAYKLPYALPPLEEQKRIVSKVDNLMALCDQLESQTLDSIATHQTLVETLLGNLVNPENTANFQAAWSLIAQNFDVLFTTEKSIDTLKQTILQLAVMGKLVPQNPNDEPASELLKKIAAEKAQLIADKKIKKSKPLPAITEAEKPFDLPNGWEWSRLPDLGELARGKSKHRPRNDPKLYIDGDIPLIQTGDVSSAKNTGGKITTYTAKYNQEGLEQSRLWSKGTLCITIAANIADSGIMSFDACFPDSVVGFTPFIEEMDVKYFDLFIRTAKADLETFAPSTAQKNINLQILSDLFVPLPPLNELNLIVAKVNELMTLCDQLKTQLQTAQQTQTHLAQSIAQEALALNWKFSINAK
ncbi:restriction endonuclease subunit S [Thiomicrorhabdus indica]|uniref:restriction endonuclease subunit S n=1 Tax=Thiomicrorhabdus indica TaxID=2267253 RepID=UPI002AA7258A|nr:restriction endonuclease subunit S [Thiomicrorhabdus indica]